MSRFNSIVILTLCLLFLSLTYPTSFASTINSNSTNINDVDYEPIYNRTEAPEGWEIGDRAEGNILVNITLNLKPRNIDVAEELLRNISNPNHPRYGQHLSAQDVSDLVAPNATVFQNVREWLHRSMNVSEIRLIHTAIQFEANVSTIERTFHTAMHWYTHSESGQRVVVQYGNSSVPQAMNRLFSGIVGLNDFPHVRQEFSVRHIQILPTPGSAAANTNAQSETDEHFTTSLEHTWKTNSFSHTYYAQTNLPITVSNMYGLPDYSNFVPSANYNPNTSIAVAQFPSTSGDQSFSPADLSTYGDQIGHATDMQVDNTRIVGSNNPSSPGVEGTLDIQTTIGLNPTAANWFFIVPVSSWVLEFTNTFLARTGPLPQVVSISYGSLEDTGSYQTNADANFLLMALRGVTIVAASGDDGANQGAAFGYGCTQNYAGTTKLHVAWPSSSPYVLSVGATEIDPNTATYYDIDIAPICGERVPQYSSMDVGFYCTRNGSEIAASVRNSGITSAGGFSRKYARPTWQSTAVNAFLNSSVAKPPSNYYDSTKRAVPDVAALGGSWAIVFSQTPALIGGTSLSAPIWAAVISMLNAETLRLNGTTLGFINPLLYQAYASDPTIFNDITSGDNICPIHKSCSGCVGWTATTGWDPVTGLGTPNYRRLLAYIVNRINAGRLCQPTYSWRANAWSSCSGNCYNPTTNPTQTRTSSCINSCTNASVADSYCTASTRPATTQSCRPTNLCFAQWSTNPNGTCSKPCGAGQLQLINTCRQSTTSTTANTNMVSVNNSICQQFTGTVPATSQVCNNFVCPVTSTCTYAWQVGTFGACSMGCYTPAAPAVQNRTVACRSSCTTGSTTTNSIVADSFCSTAGTKPSNTQSCSSGLRNCYAAWVTEFTSACSRTCGGGTRNQYVGCWQQQGGTGAWSADYPYSSVANSICTQIQGYTPATTVTCNTQRC